MFYLYFIQQLIDLYFFDTNEAIFNLLFFTYIFNLLLYKESSFLFFFFNYIVWVRFWERFLRFKDIQGCPDEIL